jgi:hypothetical protein
MHQSLFAEFADALDVDGAPDAPLPARSETNLIADFIDGFPNPVNPSEAQRFIDRLWPGDACLAGVLFVEAHPQFCFRVVMGRKPLTEIRRSFEEFRFQGVTMNNRQGAKVAREGNVKGGRG